MFGDIVYQGCHSIINTTPTLVGDLHEIQFLLNVRLGIMPVSTDSWNSCENIGANSLAQVWRRWPEMLSGPEVFLMRFSSEMMIFPGKGRARGEGEERGRG